MEYFRPDFLLSEGLPVLSAHHHPDHADCGHDHGPKHIYIYSPSSAVRDKPAFRRGIARLQALGHEVEVDPDALAIHTRCLAATMPRDWPPSTARRPAAPMSH